jgi:hypothetical protein
MSTILIVILIILLLGGGGYYGYNKFLPLPNCSRDEWHTA